MNSYNAVKRPIILVCPNQIVINKIFSSLRKRFKNPINASVYFHTALRFLDVKPEDDYSSNTDAIFFQKATDNNTHVNSISSLYFCKPVTQINLNSHRDTVNNAVKFIALTEQPKLNSQLRDNFLVFNLPNYTSNIVVMSMVKLIWTTLQLHALEDVKDVTEGNYRMLRRYFLKKIGAYQNTVNEFAIKQIPVIETQTIQAGV